MLTRVVFNKKCLEGFQNLYFLPLSTAITPLSICSITVVLLWQLPPFRSPTLGLPEADVAGSHLVCEISRMVAQTSDSPKPIIE